MRKSLILAIATVALAALPARAALGGISGFVTDPDGRALRNMCVYAYPAVSQEPTGSATSAPDGSYAIELPSGSYLVEFFDCESTGRAPQWWNDAPSRDLAAPISLNDGQTVTGIDAHLVVGGMMSGHVRDVAGEGLPRVCVTASGEHNIVVVSTGQYGFYAMTLPADFYIVSFVDCIDNEYPPQWYDGKVSPDDATVIPVHPGDIIGLVDARLTSKPDPAIAGLRVETPADTPLSQRVIVDLENQSPFASNFTLLVSVCPKTIGPCHPIARNDEHLDGTAQTTRTFDWDTSGWVGDANVTASIETEFDADPSNDSRGVKTCVVACVGVGAHIAA